MPARALSGEAVDPVIDATARAIARALIEGFDKHYALFRDCARAAKRHFEDGNYRAIGHIARERIDFYDRRVAETAARIEREFTAAGDAAADALWARVKLHYIGLLIEHRQPECAETFFNSVSCKILHRAYYNNRFIFVRPAVSTEYLDADPPTYRSYYPRRNGVRGALIDIILDCGFERRFADFRRDLRNVLAALRREFPRPFEAATNLQVQVLGSLFFRNRTAYIVGRLINGLDVRPFAVPIKHDDEGSLVVDALLIDPTELAFLFSARNSTLEAKVACGHPSTAERICPTWLLSSSTDCFPISTRSGSMPSHSSNANISPQRPMQVCTSSRQSSHPHFLHMAPSRSQNAWLGAWMPPSPSTGSIITPAT